MSLSVGIVGLPNVGKSTLFNALLKRQAALVANYPFATIEPNVGIVDVPDHRLGRLAEIVKVDYVDRRGEREVPEKLIPATIKFYDIAGLVKGASQGEGLGNEFLGHIREVDAIVHLVRNFSDPQVVKAGSETPEEDINTINTELILSDLQALAKRIERLEKELKTDKSEMIQYEHSACVKIYATLNNGELGSNAILDSREKEISQKLNLLTLKPMIYVLNSDEDILSSNSVHKDKEARQENLKISAKIESEIYSITDIEERKAFMEDLGIKESGLDMVVRKAYELLNLETYFTSGPKEVHAWTFVKGTKAPGAAGIIHTDFERGFISAEVINYVQLDLVGSMKKAQTEGLVRLEGKEYTFRDGDIAEFNFSV